MGRFFGAGTVDGRDGGGGQEDCDGVSGVGDGFAGWGSVGVVCPFCASEAYFYEAGFCSGETIKTAG